MDHPGFFPTPEPRPLRDLAQDLGIDPATLSDEAAATVVADVRPIDHAGTSHVTFLDNRKYAPLLAETTAAACLIAPQFAAQVPSGTIALVTAEPYRAFADALFAFYPMAAHPLIMGPMAQPDDPAIHPSASLEDGVLVEPGARIAAGAQIGRGTRIASGAVIGYRCAVGRDGFVGPNSVVTHALIGDRVTIHAGVMIGQDGFGFAMGPRGHRKVPQIGRVIIQDDVEIGANSTIDRGALKDTIIGEGTKIDNLVQIAHNVVVGRHCVMASQSGVAGSATLEDFVVMGGQTAVVGHITVGLGTQLAGGTGVTNDVAPGSRLGGRPARPLAQWGREIATLKKLTLKRGKSGASDD